MPKTQGNTHRTRDERDRLIRHHCEEISTHLGALKQLTNKAGSLQRIGEYVARIYVKHGGQQH